MFLKRIVAIVVAALTLTGCATYVNIPAQERDVALHQPTYDVVTDVIAASFAAVLADRPIDGPYRIVMPAGTLASQYAQVGAALGPQATWSLQGGDQALPTLDARQVRIRGFDAEVDVLRPVDATQPAGFQQLVTVYLHDDLMDDWKAVNLRAWRMNPDEALRMNQE
ncbi:MAG: hypothetical protein WD042_13280 [Phycisphaeraceae bacterium]